MNTAPNPLRIVYMGTPDFAVPALNALITSRDIVVGVVTNPDRPSGRGKKMEPPPVKVAAEKARIPVFQPLGGRDPELAAKLQEWEADVVVVAAYGQILPTSILEIPRFGCLNIHASLLPRYRGAAPINWAIVRGEDETGITIMQMEEGLDTGPMLLKKKALIAPLETAQELHDRVALMGAELIVDVMRLIHLDSLNPIVQDDELATWAPMLSKSNGQIDWTQSAQEISDHIRGFNPWPGAYSFLKREEKDERVKFHLASPVPDFRPAESTPAGTVVHVDRSDAKLLIATGDGVVQCLELQAPGRRAMSVGDFLNGYDIKVGDVFTTPQEHNQ